MSNLLCTANQKARNSHNSNLSHQLFLTLRTLKTFTQAQGQGLYSFHNQTHLLMLKILDLVDSLEATALAPPTPIRRKGSLIQHQQQQIILILVPIVLSL